MSISPVSHSSLGAAVDTKDKHVQCQSFYINSTTNSVLHNCTTGQSALAASAVLVSFNHCGQVTTAPYFPRDMIDFSKISSTTLPLPSELLGHGMASSSSEDNATNCYHWTSVQNLSLLLGIESIYLNLRYGFNKFLGVLFLLINS